jgi:quinol monooxygenase YgiN
MKDITRVVQLTLHPQHTEAFAQIFRQHQQLIAQFEGCIELNAYQDHRQSHVFFTISKWQNEASLDNYRFSPFFKELWGKVKPMFAEKAIAHSLTLV